MTPSKGATPEIRKLPRALPLNKRQSAQVTTSKVKSASEKRARSTNPKENHESQSNTIQLHRTPGRTWISLPYRPPRQRNPGHCTEQLHRDRGIIYARRTATADGNASLTINGLFAGLAKKNRKRASAMAVGGSRCDSSCFASSSLGGGL